MLSVLPGDVIATVSGGMRGHGTREDEAGVTRATVAGKVERVNKLVSVRAARARYRGEVGEVSMVGACRCVQEEQVVVGMVVELASKRWRVDVEARSLRRWRSAPSTCREECWCDRFFFCFLFFFFFSLLSLQRRRNDLDALQMRQHFVEGDLIVCEVQAVHNDGSLALHTSISAIWKGERWLLKGGFLMVGVAASWRNVGALGAVLGSSSSDRVCGRRRNGRDCGSKRDDLGRASDSCSSSARGHGS
jgi:exosome complex RNA-binding protein Rrp4